MRILHVISSLSPAGGGPPEAVRQLARAYPLIGVGVEVATQDEPGAPFLASLAFSVHAIGPGRLGAYGWSPRLAVWLRRHAPRFDGVVAHGIWSYQNLAVRSAARLARIPYAVFPHGALDPWFNRQYPIKHLKKMLYWPVQFPVLRDARAVLFTTATERDLALTSFRPSRWTSLPVPYGIGEPEGDPARQVALFYEKYPQLRGRRFFLFLSRLHQKKGCDLLVQAFASVAATAPHLDLVMAGPDQVGLQTKLQKLAADLGLAPRIHWPGMLQGDLKWGALRACEAFVLPSHQENFGIVVVEALAAGRPVLITNQVNIWRDIHEDAVGFIDDDTLDGTERLLRRWLALSHDDQAAMAARTYNSFSRRYSMKGTALAIRQLFLDGITASEKT
jgi:glycosyltransferase involved in cell wall biosynthesis